MIDETLFPGRQGRLLFAYLVAEPGSAVPRHELAEALWAESTTCDLGQGADACIVSKLRALLADHGIDGNSALTAAFGCYRLDLPEETWVDLLAATRLRAQEADHALATGNLEQANAGRPVCVVTVCAVLSCPGEDGASVEEKRREFADLR